MRSINDPKPEVPTTDPDDEINALIERIDTVLAEVEEQMEPIVGRGSGTAAAE